MQSVTYNKHLMLSVIVLNEILLCVVKLSVVCRYKLFLTMYKSFLTFLWLEQVSQQ